MAGLFLIGRLIFGGFFVFNGANLLLSHAMMTGYAAAKGVPAPDVAVFVAGVLILFGGASIILGWLPEIGIAAIAVFLVAVTFPMHNFWAISDPGQRMNEMVNFMKNTALLGGTLMFVAIPRPWPYSVDTRRPIRV
jgi:putative oxidoreductase